MDETVKLFHNTQQISSQISRWPQNHHRCKNVVSINKPIYHRSVQQLHNRAQTQITPVMEQTINV